MLRGCAVPGLRDKPCECIQHQRRGKHGPDEVEQVTVGRRFREDYLASMIVELEVRVVFPLRQTETQRRLDVFEDAQETIQGEPPPSTRKRRVARGRRRGQGRRGCACRPSGHRRRRLGGAISPSYHRGRSRADGDDGRRLGGAGAGWWSGARSSETSASRSERERERLRPRATGEKCTSVAEAAANLGAMDEVFRAGSGQGC